MSLPASIEVSFVMKQTWNTALNQAECTKLFLEILQIAKNSPEESVQSAVAAAFETCGYTPER